MRRLLIIGAVLLLGSGIIAWRALSAGNGVSELCDTERVFEDRRVEYRSSLDSISLGPVVPIDRALELDARTADPRLFVAAKSGEVWAVDSGETELVLDLSGSVAEGYEQGLLGLAISPDGEYLYLNYTDLDGTTHVTEYAFRNGTPSESSRRDVLTIEQMQSFHNGGGLAFTADGLLWIATGEDGRGNPSGDADSVYGAILRINPRPDDGTSYGIPDDNPYATEASAAPEVWAHGLRNPWRFAIDPDTNDLWIGDVGQDCWEEIDHVTGESGGGAERDFGWSRFEGDWTYGHDGSRPDGVTFPAFVGAQDDGYCSIAGGEVYRGSDLPELFGWYLFADWCIGEIMAMRPISDGSYEVRGLGLMLPGVVSFGVDNEGEIYVVSIIEGVFPLTPAD